MNGSFPSSRGQGCDRQMIFDMLKRLRSVVYLPNDYVCKKVSGRGGCGSPRPSELGWRGPMGRW